ncbi:MAG: hypothetical protein B7Z03_13755 [Hydrogenophilales bacterium 32-62-9]|nr:MAG: hypothetical protein B7Z03_13755 [Hydrogenophilales bacterium 32-62-9]
MAEAMAMGLTGLAAFDGRPFFDKALHHGVKQGMISAERLRAIEADFAKGIVQIANYFGTAYLRPDLELAVRRMVYLMSLYLEEVSGGDLALAAASLRDKTLLSHSKGGSDMLKRLQAMPDSSLMLGNIVSPDSQRAYLDDKTAASPFTLTEYRAERAARQGIQDILDFSLWLARKMGVARGDYDDADALIRSAMLVLFVDKAALVLPTRSGFVHLVKAARRPKAKLDDARFQAFVADASPTFRQLAAHAMARFIEQDLQRIRADDATADKLLYGDTAQPYFVSESLDEDVSEYDRLVAKEWQRVTRGESDDPQVLATVFLLLATGLPPRASLLLKEAKEITRIFRRSAFDSDAVIAFIDQHAPESQRADLRRAWSDDIRREAEERLADTDPNWPDAYMERALTYLHGACRATWKSRRR